MAGDQKKARREERTVVFLDESGFMLQPLVRRTWAPIGQTPIHTMSSKHDRLSVISAITVSPNRRRLGFYFCIYDENINADGVVLFLRWIQRHIQRNMIVVWDRLNAHRTAERRIRRRSGNRILFEYLPSYSPELNPVEQIWCHSKWVDEATRQCWSERSVEG
ncbi:IS630 family transposase [Myxococcota bacterium]